MRNVMNDNDPSGENAKSTPQRQLQEMEGLADTLKWLLVQQEVPLDEENIRREIKILEKWTESHHRGIAATDRISETDVERLLNLRNRLKLAAEERQRLEDEGGNPASKEQAKRTEELLEAARCIDKAIPDILQMLSQAA